MMNEMSTLRKSRKFYFFLCGVMLLSLFLKVQAASSAPAGIAVETFTRIDFVEDRCWNFLVGSGIIQYTNGCVLNSAVVLTLLDGTQKTFLVAPQGKLVFLGGSVVHILKEFP